MAAKTDWDIKLDRAQELIDEVTESVVAFFNARKAGTRIDESDPYRRPVYLRLAEPPPHRWSALVGDVVGNLHSALDNFCRQAIEAHLQRSVSGNVYFPITMNKGEFNEWTVKRSGRKPQQTLKPRFDARIDAAFRAVQPWLKADLQSSGDPKGARLYVEYSEPLRVLQRLNNRNKHRALHPVFMMMRQVEAGGPPGLDAVFAFEPDATKDGDLIGTWRLKGIQPRDTVYLGHTLQVSLAGDVVVLPGTTEERHTGWSVSDRLAVLRAAAADAIAKVEAAL